MIRRIRLAVRTLRFQCSNMGSTPICAAMHPKYQEAIKLRKKGKSYREIAKIAGVSKSSISQWCKNLKLPLFAQKILEKKNRQDKEILTKYNNLKAEMVRKENQRIRKEAVFQVHPLSKYELLLIGTALYWGEGYKKEDRDPNHGICFVNSDPQIVRLFLRFLREIIKVSEEKFYVDIRIHPNISGRKVINFWAKVTSISKERFQISRQISKSSQGKRPKNSLPYGTLKLTINNRQQFQQIKGWIEGLIRQGS